MASDSITRRLRQPEYLRAYLADTGREYATGKNVKCPNAAAHAHGDANPSAKIYENANGALVKCYGCGGSWDIFGLWEMDNGGSFADAKAALCARFEVAQISGATGIPQRTHTPGGNPAEIRALAGSPVTKIGTAQGNAVVPDYTPATTPDRRTRDYIEAKAVAFLSGTDGEAGRAYMEGRGIGKETARRFNIGYDAETQTIIIPQGAGYMARSIKPNAEQKEKCRYYPKGAPRVLFNTANMERAAKDGTPVFIVEGEMDALSFAEVGGVAVSTGGTGGIGKAIKAISQIGRGVYVPCMDRDEQGEKAQAALVAKLREIGGAVYVYEGAPQRLLPDAADGTHPKDANEALQKDIEEFWELFGEVSKQAKAYARAEEERKKPYYTLAEIPEPPPEENNPRALFRRGWLRKGGGVILASVAGGGKSTFGLQCALHWVLGVPCFGMEPVRPLKIALIQAEDDIEEMAMFRANMKQGLAAEGFTPERIAEALTLLHLRKDFLGKTGADFASALGSMQAKCHYDLVIVNPLNSYFDGDISLNKDATEFFRKQIDPVIKNAATECGILFIHHLSKPAKGKDAATFGKGAYAQYSLQGGAELNNWARAVLIMIPFENEHSFWTLTAAKRDKPLAWKDADGKGTREKVIAYSPNCVYWREPSEAEVAAAREGRRTLAPKETEEEHKRNQEHEIQCAIAEIVAYLQHLPDPISKNKLYQWCDENPGTIFKGFHNHTVENKKTGKKCPKRPCYLAFELVTERPLDYGVGYHVGKYKNGKEYYSYGGFAGEVAHENNRHTNGTAADSVWIE